MLRRQSARPLCAWTRCRWLTGNAAPSLDSKAYSKTLLLPKTSFPLWNDPAKSEIPYRKKTSEDLYEWQKCNLKGPLFVLHDGPPYANGNLHMGHALNKILKDIINRFHLLQGRRINYKPGWDCHGLPIENKALKELNKAIDGLPGNVIRASARSVALREIETQKEEFRQFGIVADWSKEGTYRTLDHAYELRQLRVFQNLIYRHFRPVDYSPSSRSALAEAELVYEDNHVSTSVYVTFNLKPLSGLTTRLCKILTDLDNVELLVWTTTPWTLTANMAIAVHPEIEYSLIKRKLDARLLVVASDRKQALSSILGDFELITTLYGSDLVNCGYQPIFRGTVNELKPVVAASHVTTLSGSGLVHCAPAHGEEDYHALRSLGLLTSPDSIICHVDGQGRFSDKVAAVVGSSVASQLIGKEVLYNGSTSIVDILRGSGHLLHEEKFKHRYPYDWKTKEPVIVTATSQWFANLENLKNNALESLNGVSFYPPSSRARLESFIKSRSEWCISRQRAWGVPIPSLHHIPSDTAVLNSASLSHILGVLEAKGVKAWWDDPVEDFVPLQLHRELGGAADGSDIATVWKKGTDTMDVWFDSGSSWALLRDLGIFTESPDAKAGQIADVYLEGSDQHRGWFQSSLLTATACQSKTGGPLRPYGAVLTHGMVLDQEGKKMSKSIGNIISPMTVINGGKDKKRDPPYGADVLRFWAASVEYWRDMALGPAVLAQASESLRKIRNSARFILGNIGGDKKSVRLGPHKEDMPLAERYMMHELYKLESMARAAYAEYNFPRVVTSLNHFANITLSSLYFDITKDCLYADAVGNHQREIVVAVLEQILTTMTSIIAPIAPHLAEEIYYIRSGSKTSKGEGLSAFTQTWEPLANQWEDQLAASDMNDLLRVRSAVNSLLETARVSKHIKSSLEAEVELQITQTPGRDTDLLRLLRREEIFLKTLFIVSDARITDETHKKDESYDWSYTDATGLGETILLRIRPARQQKCPRCWTYSRRQEQSLCTRCAQAIGDTVER